MDDTSRPRLRMVAYRLLGTFAEADEALREADDLLALARVCHDALRARATRAFLPRVPDPVISSGGTDAVNLGMMFTLDRTYPAERLVFVLHDLYAVPLEDIAPLVRRTPEEAGKVAARVRRRVLGPARPYDTRAARSAIDAFLAVALAGDVDALPALLSPLPLMRCDGGSALPHLNRNRLGAPEVAESVADLAAPTWTSRAVLVNGRPGALLVGPAGDVLSVVDFEMTDDRVDVITALADPARLATLPTPPDDVTPQAPLTQAPLTQAPLTQAPRTDARGGD